MQHVEAGGVGGPEDFAAALDLGYAGAQLGTRFLASHECQVTAAYKQAIVEASSDDIVWTNRLAGTNSSVIRTPLVEEGGLRVGPVMAWLLRNSYTKLITRTLMLQNAMSQYKRAAFEDDYALWQAGKGVDSIDGIQSCAEIVAQFGEVARADP